MSEPKLALLLMFGAPLASCWRLRPSLALAFLLACAAAASGEGWERAGAAAAIAAAGCGVLCAATRRLGSAVLPLLAWLALALLPVWAPALAARLDGSTAAFSGAWWAVWPGGLLGSSAWDPLLLPPLYGPWGSRTGVLEPSLFVQLLVLGVLGALLYCLPLRRRDPRGGEG